MSKKINALELEAKVVDLIQKRQTISTLTHQEMGNLRKLEAEIFQDLTSLVENKVRKYKSFSNYPDLYQDGMEALSLALGTFQLGKGSFLWWANKYVGTRVSRQANCHSTIRIPLTKAGKLRPRKESVIPSLFDPSLSAEEQIENAEKVAALHKCVRQLSPLHQEILRLSFQEEMSREEIATELQLTRHRVGQILRYLPKKIRASIAQY